MLSAIVGREIFIRSELKVLRTQLHEQIRQQFSSVEDYERLGKLALAPTVYERYLEPVLLTSNKLIWPLTRDSEMSSWRREVHGFIDDQIYQQKLRMKTAVGAEVAKINSEEDASILRLMKVLDARGRLLEDPEFKNLVKDEIQKISTSALAEDRKTLDEIRFQGVAIVRSFKEKLRKMDHRGLASFLTSGKYSRDIQQPIVELILKLKQEETRRSTWNEFQKALTGVMDQKKTLISKNSNKREIESKISDDAKRFQALFESVAESVTREDDTRRPLVVTPPEQDFSPDFSNPAGPDYQE